MTDGDDGLRDDELVARAKAGDEEAWRELYRAHAGRLVVWLRTIAGGDPAVSPEDLAAEAWLTAAAKVADFEGTSSQFAGYLFGIGRHLAANDRRRVGRRQTFDVDPADLTAAGPAEEPHREVDDQAWVRWRLSALPTREREVIACLEVVGLDIASSAAALGMSATAVRVARHRGLRRLRATSDTPTTTSTTTTTKSHPAV
jgi:RNA polymerase sigma-70 factor (ECF subfamily)